MRTKTILIATLLLLTAMLCFITGCDDDDDEGVNNSSVSDLFGTWLESSATLNGTAVNLADLLEWEEGTVKGTVTLNSNYSYSANNYDTNDSSLYSETGTFVIDDNWIILTSKVVNDSTITPEQAFNGTWTTNGTTLSLTQTIGNETMVLTLTKQN